MIFEPEEIKYLFLLLNHFGDYTGLEVCFRTIRQKDVAEKREYLIYSVIPVWECLHF